MLLLMTRVPPLVAWVALLLAHLAVLLDIAVRRDLPWWRRLLEGVAVGVLLPLGALVYLLARPVGARMRRRVDRRRPRPVTASRLHRTARRAVQVGGVAVAFTASVVAGAAADPVPFAPAGDALAQIGADQAWQTDTGKGITVAVVDSGVDADNPVLASRLLPGIDLADDTHSTKDELGHGTHVAGIIAQTAPDAKILPVRVLDKDGNGNEGTIAAGVRWAVDHGAQVINVSIDASGLLAQIQKEGKLGTAAKYADAKGAVLVSAAGNDHVHLQVFRAGVPAITVAAVDDQDKPATFTNWGGSAEVAAPGVDILSTAPTYPTTLWPQGTDGTGTLSGTSMATPFVAGVAALLRGNGATASATEAALLNTARPVPGTDILGHGVVDAPAALAYAHAHPHARVATFFAPRWFLITQLVLIVLVAVKYAWVLASWARRRWSPARAPALGTSA